MANIREYILYSFIYATFCSRCISDADLEPKQELLGVGASFPGFLYRYWTFLYENSRDGHLFMNTEYFRRGSQIGKDAMKAPTNASEFAYGGSEALLTDEEYNDYPDLQMVPIVGGAVVLAYNMPGLKEFNLTRDALVGIYNGTVQAWDDPTITSVNPNFPFPPFRIHPVARLDWSGTTEVFTTALSMFSPEWNDTYGVFAEGADEEPEHPIPYKWNQTVVRMFGRQGTGVLSRVFTVRFTIGYVSVADTKRIDHVVYARLLNVAGNFVDVTSTGIKNAMSSAIDRMGERMTANLIDVPGPNIYPITTFSYFIIRMSGMPDCDLAVELVRYIEWVSTDRFADDQATGMRMAQITSQVYLMVHQKVIKRMTCGPNSENVWELVEKQIELERRGNIAWKITVIICTPVMIIFIIGLISYVIYQQIKLRQISMSDDWLIPATEIDIKWDREHGIVKGSKSKMGSTISSQTFQSDVSHAGFDLSGPNHMVGVWQEIKVGLRMFPRKGFRISKNNTKVAINILRTQIVHDDVQRFFGVTLIDDIYYLVGEHAEKGTLSDIIQNQSYDFDANFKFIMALDVASGMDYLHNQGLTHGSLNSNCCLLDSKWNVKVSSWEINKLYAEQKLHKVSAVVPMETASCYSDPNITARANLWAAPEVLRGHLSEPNKRSDVYSYSILLVEIFTRQDPYQEVLDKKTAVEVLDEVLKKNFRPDVSMLDTEAIIPLMESCWDEEPDKRPTFSYLCKRINHIRPSKKSVIEIMMKTLETYVTNLEDMVHERTIELETVNASLETLLHQILPPTVALKLSRGEIVDPESFDSVTIFFSDIVSFTTLCSDSTPMEVVTFLNDLYTCFDSIIDQLDVYKVETVGDAYMCISGLPVRNGIKHAGQIATMALALVHAVKNFEVRHKPDYELRLRAGIHSGPAVAGVVGQKMPRYCLFGDTVNIASRMESNSLPMKIQTTGDTKSLLDTLVGYKLQKRGLVEVKGKGHMTTYFIEGKDDLHLPLSIKTSDPTTSDRITDSFKSLRTTLATPESGQTKSTPI